ncbi:MAG: 2-phosphosulfolactate phosphatase [Candidatus Eisenbacteria bacterium]|nr:2-phosphosulfolactate phosphatase [Candidatus Eisenbacteria bacterium]
MSEDAIRLDLHFTPLEMGDKTVKGKRAVVVDVLRFCTTVACALQAGAERIIPVASTDDVARLMGSLDRKETLLCGKRLDGYQLSNSPEEYTPETVGGKTLLMSTNNGPASVARCDGAKEILLASLVNLGALVERVAREDDWIVICAGRNGRFALEDALCAGALVSGIRNRGLPLDANDAGRSAEFLFRSAGGDLPAILRGTEAGKALAEQGFERDVELCSRIDTVPIVPVVQDGRILKP